MSRMKVAIVGYGVEGVASYEYFTRHGHEVTICDQAADLQVPAGARTHLGDDYLNALDRFDLIVRTAGMHPKVILDKNPGVAGKITTQLNEFLRVCPTRHLIGITGTKGKGTTSTLTAKMLEASGKDVYLGGNIGVPLFAFLDKLTPESWVVLELSSFQLIDVQFSPHIAACLMVVPEHLNWHADLEEYLAAKSQLFAHQQEDDIAIYFADNNRSRLIAAVGEGQKIPYFAPPGAFVRDGAIVIDDQTICKTDELKLLGQHNWQNACAAVTAMWFSLSSVEGEAGVPDIAALRSVLTTFSGLEHRLEFVRELDSVKYYDDSFGTTPETAIVAIEAFAQPKILILGGSDKGARYDELARTVARSNVRKVVLIGSEGPKLQKALETAGFHDFTPVITGREKMPDIIKTARQNAQPGDVVLLSVACASFDMFNDYKDRGNQFKQAVSNLT